MAENKTFNKLMSLMAYDNKLTEEEGDFYLRVKTMPDSIDLHAVAREVAARLGGKNEDEVYAILNAAEGVKCDAVSSGFMINTPFCQARPAASGSVMKTDLSKAVDRSRVKVYANLTMGSDLRESLDACQLEIFTQPAPVGPIVNGASSGRFEADGTTRAPIEAGGALTVEGSRIKLVGDSPQVGVTLTSVSDPEVSYFIPPTAMLINEPKRLMFVLPKEVTEGSWQVTVTTQYSHAKQTVKKPRSFTMDMPFTIGEATEPGGGEEEGGGGSMG